MDGTIRLTVQIIAWGIAVLFLLAALFGVGIGLGIVGVTYDRTVENQPLHDPQTVASVDDQGNIVLADGRRFQLAGLPGDPESLRRAVRGLERCAVIELALDENGFSEVFGKRYRTRCGFRPEMVVIPLFPKDIPRYYKEYLGLATAE